MLVPPPTATASTGLGHARSQRGRGPTFAVVAPVLLAAGLLLFSAGPASAHTEVTSSPGRAGTANAVLTFDCEAESSTAGIQSVRVVLPKTITADLVALVDGPAGWKLTPTPGGYTVAGKALPIGQDATHRIRVKQLPQARTLLFKTLDTYSDGRVDRWIEPAVAGAPEPDHPAPVLTLGPAADSATPAGAPIATDSINPSVASAPESNPSSNAQSASEPTSPALSANPVDTESGNRSTGPWLALGGVAAAASVAVATVLLRRRRNSPHLTRSGGLER